MCPSITDYGFSSHNRLDEEDIDFQYPDPTPIIPPWGLDDDLISGVTIDKLFTGTISSKQITLAVTPDEGDVYLAAGKTDFNNSVAGFILGIDDSDSDTAKFYVGDSSNYINWTGSALNISGTLSIGSLPNLPEDFTLLAYWAFDEGAGSVATRILIKGSYFIGCQGIIM